MIKKDIENIDKIKNQHFNGVLFYIKETIDFYCKLLPIINRLQHNDVVQEKSLRKIFKDCKLHHRTKASLASLFLKNSVNSENTFVIAFASKDSIKSIQEKNFIKDAISLLKVLKEDNYSNVKKLIVGSPEKNYLLNLNNNLSQLFNYDKEKAKIKNNNKENEKYIRKVFINKIFDYDKLGKGFKDSSGNVWNSYNLTNALEIDTCLYCNRNQIYTVTKKNEKTTNQGVVRPQLDHFLDKARHPFLALSFYNLIPSCSQCNSSLKGTEEFNMSDYMHPYFEGFGNDAKFSFNPVNTSSLYGFDNQFKVFFELSDALLDKKKNKVEQHIDIFKIDAIYSHYGNIIEELVLKQRANNKRHFDIIKDTYQNLNLSQSDIYRLAFGNFPDEKEFHKRPLAKFIKDLAVELELVDEEDLID